MAFVAENELETALVAAATDPVARPRFYEVLRSSMLLVVNEGGADLPIEQGVLAAGATLSLRSLDLEGVPHAPVFSSPTRISAMVPGEVRFVAMKALDLFEMVEGSHLILNPGSDYGKQLTPGEIASVREGTIFEPRSREIVEKDRQVLLGQPASYPDHLTTALSAIFATGKVVRAAYLAHMADPSTGVLPHTVIGVDVSSDSDAVYDRVIGEAMIVLEGVAKKDELVDFIRIGRESAGISSYMTKTKPFYRRRWLGIF